MNLFQLWEHERQHAEVAAIAAVTNRVSGKFSRRSSSVNDLNHLNRGPASKVNSGKRLSIYPQRLELIHENIVDSARKINMPDKPTSPIYELSPNYRTEVNTFNCSINSNAFAMEYANKVTNQPYTTYTLSEANQCQSERLDLLDCKSKSKRTHATQMMQTQFDSPKVTKSSPKHDPPAPGPSQLNSQSQSHTEMNLRYPDPDIPSNCPERKQIVTSRASRKTRPGRQGKDAIRNSLVPYFGDIFGTRGTYVDGILYMSRMTKASEVGSHHIKSMGTLATVSTLATHHGYSDKRKISKKGVESAQYLESTSIEITPSNLRRIDGNVIAKTDMTGFANLAARGTEQRQQCSLTLSNWSSNPENAKAMVEECVVDALVTLCSTAAEVVDYKTQLNCMTALMNLSQTCELRAEIINKHAVLTVGDVVKNCDDRHIRTMCAITICNLCCAHNGEQVLVEDGVVPTLALLINVLPPAADLCRVALFNLTCVKHPYYKIESVIKLCLALATSVDLHSSAHELHAKALVNLSNFKTVRSRLMEEGILSVIANMSRMTPPPVQELLSYILLNLSAVRSCCSALITKGCMSTFLLLTHSRTTFSAKTFVARALLHLSQEPENRLRMVQEGLLMLVEELCSVNMKYNDAMLSEHAAQVSDCVLAIYNVSCTMETRQKLVERDAVKILSTLYSYNNTSVKLLSHSKNKESNAKLCTLTLCNLLSVEQAAQYIASMGAVTQVVNLCAELNQPASARLLFAKALYSLCENSSTRVALTHAGVTALLLLSDNKNVGSSYDLEKERSKSTAPQDPYLSNIRLLCAASFALLAGDDSILPLMCTDDVVKCLTGILIIERAKSLTEQFCCISFSSLSKAENCSTWIVNNSSIKAITDICLTSQDIQTKASCCHTLACISAHSYFFSSLIQNRIVYVLSIMVKVKNPLILRCCSIVLANLTASEEFCRLLEERKDSLKNGVGITDTFNDLNPINVIEILQALSSTYSEESQQDCAKILCSLSSMTTIEEDLVREGAIRVLMMISMVRALSIEAKETCLRAMCNFLNDITIQYIVQEGVITVLPILCALDGSSLKREQSKANLFQEREEDSVLLRFDASLFDIVVVIYYKLLKSDAGRQALSKEISAIAALLKCIQANVNIAFEDTSRGSYGILQCSVNKCPNINFLEDLLVALVYYDNIREASIQAGILKTVHTFAQCQHNGTIPSHCSAKKLAYVLYKLATCTSTQMVVVQSHYSIEAICWYIVGHSPLTNCNSSLCTTLAIACTAHLSLHDEARIYIQKSVGIANSLVQMLTKIANTTMEQSISVSAVRMCILSLCCIGEDRTQTDGNFISSVIPSIASIISKVAKNDESENIDRPVLIPDFCHDAESSSNPRQEFNGMIALMCILTRQLSYQANGMWDNSKIYQHFIDLLCLLASVVGGKDSMSSLDLACALCSICISPSLIQVCTHNNKVNEQPFNPSSLLLSKEAIEMIDNLLGGKQELINFETQYKAAVPNESYDIETQFRVIACIRALTSIPENRMILITLGCTRILVRESYRAVTNSNNRTSVHKNTVNSSPVHFPYQEAIRYCSAALCNLSALDACNIKESGRNESIAIMISHGVIPALLQLAECAANFDDPYIRIDCTQALSNLSIQSPKLQSGAVSALLSLSKSDSQNRGHSLKSNLSESEKLQFQLSTRPPTISSGRHITFGNLPTYGLKLHLHTEILTTKFAPVHIPISIPPHMPIPVIPSDLNTHSEDISANRQSKQQNRLSISAEPTNLCRSGLQNCLPDSEHSGRSEPIEGCIYFPKEIPSSEDVLSVRDSIDDSDTDNSAGDAEDPDDKFENSEIVNHDQSSNESDIRISSGVESVDPSQLHRQKESARTFSTVHVTKRIQRRKKRDQLLSAVEDTKNRLNTPHNNEELLENSLSLAKAHGTRYPKHQQIKKLQKCISLTELPHSYSPNQSTSSIHTRKKSDRKSVKFICPLTEDQHNEKSDFEKDNLAQCVKLEFATTVEGFQDQAKRLGLWN